MSLPPLLSQLSLSEGSGLLFEDHPQPMWAFDCETLRFMAVNAAAVHHYGYAREEFLRMTIRDIRPPEDIPALAAHLAGVSDDHLDRAGLWRHRRKDGALIWVEITSTPVLLQGRRAALTLVHDVTEQKAAQAALAESEDRYRDLVENSRDLICTHDLQGKILSANPWAARASGFEREALVGKNIRDLLTPVTAPGFEEYLGAIRREGAATGFMEVLTERGERRIWQYNNTLREEGVVAPVVRGMAQDVTERFRAEAEFRRQKEVFEKIFNGLPLMVLFFDSEGQLSLANPEWERVTGWTAEDARAADRLPELCSDPVEQQRTRACVAAATGEWGEFKLHTRGGEVIDTLWANIRLSDGTRIGIGQDVTQRRREALLLEHYRLLSEHSRDLMLFIRSDGRIVEANRAAVRAYGYTREELLGLSIDDLRATTGGAPGVAGRRADAPRGQRGTAL
jgi:PAS domain S-box-containing protein